MYIIGFGEIFTKGDNQNFFVSILLKNIKKSLNLEDNQLLNLHNRYIVLTENAENLRYIFGLSFYAKVIKTDFDRIKEIALSLIKKEKTFKISAKRLTKEYKTSPEINVEVGDYILKNKKIKVKLDEPEIEIKVEILNGKAYIYSSKDYQKGLQGLPVGTAGHIYLDYKNKINATVAGYLLMKRGCNLILPKPIKELEKFSYNNNIKISNTKIEFIAKELTLKQIPKDKTETIFYPLIGFKDKQIKEMYKKIIKC